MLQKSYLATLKDKIVYYCNKELKAKVELLVSLQDKSTSNLVERVLKKLGLEAIASGELLPEK